MVYITLRGKIVLVKVEEAIVCRARDEGRETRSEGLEGKSEGRKKKEERNERDWRNRG